MSAASLAATGILCPIGRGAAQVWASARARISRVGASAVMDRLFEPIQMGLVPKDALEPQLPPEIELLPLPSRARRMLRLGAPALRQVADAVGDSPVRLYLALPQLSLEEAPWLQGFALHLANVAGMTLDAADSRVVPAGRAGALVALELALDALASDPQRPVVVGGVDTLLDLKLLAHLHAEGRILGSRVSDGFIPGEGAAFLVLSGSQGGAASITVQGAASAADAGHRSASVPARGEGLAQALEILRARAGASAPVATVVAGLNGESFEAKQWGVARARHSDFFAPLVRIVHPADCMGDAGAALGAILLVVAAAALSSAARPGPALVWAASDGEARACALLSAS